MPCGPFFVGDDSNPRHLLRLTFEGTLRPSFHPGERCNLPLPETAMKPFDLKGWANACRYSGAAWYW
jgi:hypothetical protein